MLLDAAACGLQYYQLQCCEKQCVYAGLEGDRTVWLMHAVFWHLPGQPWSLEALREYVAWVKAAFAPVMSAEAEGVLLGYWRLARGSLDRQAERSTVRMLESLVRLAQARSPCIDYLWPLNKQRPARPPAHKLSCTTELLLCGSSASGALCFKLCGALLACMSALVHRGNGCGGVCPAQAHARLMARSTVMQQDAVVAVSLVEASSTAAGVLCCASSLHSDFPDDPDAEYLRMDARILAALSAHEGDMELP
jgi:hypothetical protein